jgi:hypothetical protein
MYRRLFESNQSGSAVQGTACLKAMSIASSYVEPAWISAARWRRLLPDEVQAAVVGGVGEPQILVSLGRTTRMTCLFPLCVILVHAARAPAKRMLAELSAFCGPQNQMRDQLRANANRSACRTWRQRPKLWRHQLLRNRQNHRAHARPKIIVEMRGRSARGTLSKVIVSLAAEYPFSIVHLWNLKTGIVSSSNDRSCGSTGASFQSWTGLVWRERVDCTIRSLSVTGAMIEIRTSHHPPRDHRFGLTFQVEFTSLEGLLWACFEQKYQVI